MKTKTANKEIKGYKEVITEGYNKYDIQITSISGKTETVEMVAKLYEIVPDYKSCGICKRYVSNYEEAMANTIIPCEHDDCHEKKINEITIMFNCGECGGRWNGKPDNPYWNPKGTQEYFCFECLEEML